MNFKQLEALIYVVRNGTFKKAAESLYFDSPVEEYTTPESIQYRIKQLEQDLGVSLYQKNRGSARVQLTREGQIFLKEAVDVYQRMLEWKGIFLENHDRTLTFATTQAVLIHRLLDPLKKFRELHPKTTVCALNSTDHEELERSMLEGKLDFAFATRPPDSPSLEYVLWKRSRYVLVTPKNHRLATRPAVALSELTEEPLVALTPDARGDRDTIGNEFNRIGCKKPNIVMEASNSEIITAYVEAGVGVAIISETNMLNQRRDVKSIPITDLKNKSEIGLLTRRAQYISWSTREFLNLVDPLFSQWLEEREARGAENEEVEEELPPPTAREKMKSTMKRTVQS
ncbi:MAG: LysR family transcriptional regulator [Candidatus Sumerlaeia bacterium]|nr:LysR family transcriptional regulator [Candidatus Sumerlaeia bacterium]